jgi:hypothetical protein
MVARILKNSNAKFRASALGIRLALDEQNLVLTGDRKTFTLEVP